MVTLDAGLIIVRTFTFTGIFTHQIVQSWTVLFSSREGVTPMGIGSAERGGDVVQMRDVGSVGVLNQVGVGLCGERVFSWGDV